MGGRNGGEMEKTSLETKANGKKSSAVKTPRKDSGETTKARGKGQKKPAAKKTGKAANKATKKIERKKRKGAKKALRHAVQREVKENCGKFAHTLVDKRRKATSAARRW